MLTLAGGVLILWLLGIPAISKAVQESLTQDSVATRRLIEAFVTGGYADAVVYRLGELVWVILSSVIVLLIDQRPSLPFLPPLAKVGRMALTNYLGQSLIATTLFYGYGFGLTGSVGKLGTIGIAVLIFAAQILFSVLWLRSFRHGPMEWLWRSFTYGVRQPMRREHQLTQ